MNLFLLKIKDFFKISRSLELGYDYEIVEEQYSMQMHICIVRPEKWRGTIYCYDGPVSIEEKDGHAILHFNIDVSQAYVMQDFDELKNDPELHRVAGDILTSIIEKGYIYKHNGSNLQSNSSATMLQRSIQQEIPAAPQS